MTSKKWKRIIVWVGNTILALLILIGILVAVSLLPIKDNYKILAVTSGSMEPTIKVGSLAIVQPASNYYIDDIITFKKSNTAFDKETTTHRIVEIIENENGISYRTKGDANKTADTKPVDDEQIVGKYYFSIALLGYIIKYIKSLPGLVLIIIIPATIIIYEEIKKIHKEIIIKKPKKKASKSPKKEKL